MNTAVVNIKISPDLKTQAQYVAAELGFSLSSLIKAYLKQLVKTKTVTFSLADKEPSDYLVQAIKEAEEERKTGWVSPGFNNAKDAIVWLDDPNRKYVCQIQQEVQ